MLAWIAQHPAVVIAAMFVLLAAAASNVPPGA